MKRNIVSFVIVIVICIIVGYKIFNKQTAGDTNTFIIGTAAGYAPFVSINAQGDYEGFDIDIAQALACAMGKKLEIKDLGSMTSLFMALNQGAIDAIIWGLSITKDRLEKVAMVRYQGDTVTSYPLIFWQKIPAGIKSINDMKGMTVCVEPTSSQDTVLSRYPFIVKKSTEKVDDALLNIQYNKADAAFVEPAIAKKFQQKYPEIKILEVPLSDEDQVHGIGIALLPGNKSLIDAVQRAVNQLRKNNCIGEYELKWNIS